MKADEIRELAAVYVLGALVKLAAGRTPLVPSLRPPPPPPEPEPQGLTQTD